MNKENIQLDGNNNIIVKIIHILIRLTPAPYGFMLFFSSLLYLNIVNRGHEKIIIILAIKKFKLYNFFYLKGLN